MWNYMVSIFSHLKWACNFLLCYCFAVLPNYSCDVPKPTSYSTGELSVTRYHCESSDSADHENIECAVCLSKIEEGQEIGELRCSHFFHKVCLHKWVAGFNRTTCPLCRGSLAAPPLAEPESGVEVLLIRPWSIRSDDDLRDTWWLR